MSIPIKFFTCNKVIGHKSYIYNQKTQICLVCDSIQCRCHILKRHRLYRIESKTGKYKCKKCNHTYEKCYCKGGIKFYNDEYSKYQWSYFGKL